MSQTKSSLTHKFTSTITTKALLSLQKIITNGIELESPNSSYSSTIKQNKEDRSANLSNKLAQVYIYIYIDLYIYIYICVCV